MLERLIVYRLEQQIELYGGISDRQFGFRPKKTTSDAVLRIRETVNKAKVNKRACAIIGVDISNAFNSLDWSAILKALERYRLPGYLTRIIQDYLCERYIIYELRDGKTYRRYINRGVPQGSALGPLLWVSTYDGILRHPVPKGIRVIGYTDDTAIIAQGETLEDVHGRATEAIALLDNKLHRMGLQVAPTKTEILFFRHGLSGMAGFELSTFGVNIRPSENMRYLGFELDTRWDFSRHLLLAANKANKAACALTRLMPNLRGPSESKRRLYIAMIHSIMLYGAPVWQPNLSNRKVAPLIAVQNLMAKRIIAAYKTVSGVAARTLANIPPADLLAKRHYVVFNKIKHIRIKERIEILPRARKFIWKEADQEMKREWREQLQQTGQSSPRIRQWMYPYHEAWLNRRWGLDFRTTQLITGHGCFGNYLYRIQKETSPECVQCGAEVDEARHTLMDCVAWANIRNEIGWINQGPDWHNLLGWLITSDNNWKTFRKFASIVIATKEAEERQRQGQPSGTIELEDSSADSTDSMS